MIKQEYVRGDEGGEGDVRREVAFFCGERE
jgi:hypothetical protein